MVFKQQCACATLMVVFRLIFFFSLVPLSLFSLKTATSLQNDFFFLLLCKMRKILFVHPTYQKIKTDFFQLSSFPRKKISMPKFFTKEN
jgi:hypothetical protein